MNHIKSIEEFIFEKKNPCWPGYKQIGMKNKNGKKVPNCVKVNEQLFSDARKFSQMLGVGNQDSQQALYVNTPTGPIQTSRNDEASCPNNDCWSHFGKEAFWNGDSKINNITVPKITIQKSPTLFKITYSGQVSGFLLKHAKGGKGDTIHQLLNVLTLELNEYLKGVSAKPDVNRIKMTKSGNVLEIEVPLVSGNGKKYMIARRGGLGHGGDFTGLRKYKKMEGYEEAVHKSENLTEKFVTVVVS